MDFRLKINIIKIKINIIKKLKNQAFLAGYFFALIIPIVAMRAIIDPTKTTQMP